ncbi:hypothetical protein [Photorhabdus asymbiotica]|uniref:hypothetical protein n=1 Tax=Photorhabdus asymbiotica TaxID=291112 RepID=UPI003DA795CA
MNKKIPSKKIRHSNTSSLSLDPYEMLKNKSKRLSWNGLSNPDIFLDKAATIEWFSLLRDYSDEMVNLAIIEGIFDNKFHNISFILSLVQSEDFREKSSMEVYNLLYNFVCSMPKTLRDWIDDEDFSMSQNVLALLSKNRGSV